MKSGESEGGVTHPCWQVGEAAPFVLGSAEDVAGGVGDVASAAPPANVGDAVAGAFVKGSAAELSPPRSQADTAGSRRPRR